MFSQIKDIKDIERYFHSVAWVMWDFVVLGGQKCSFSEHGHVAYQIGGDDE